MFAAGRAAAQSAEAEALFNEGDTLMGEGRLAEACDAFDASNRIEPRAGTLIRLGECREQNQQIASAWAAYKDALTRAKDPRKRDIALAKSTELEAKLSYLTISVPDDVRVDGLAITRNSQPLDPALWNRAFPVDGGEYVIGGSAPGHEAWSTSVTVPMTGGKIDVDVPELLVTPPPITVTPLADEPVTPLADEPVTPLADETVTPPSDAEHRTTSAGMFTARRKLAVGLAAVGGVGLIAGSLLGVSAQGKQTDAHALCPDTQTPCADADRATELSKSGHGLAIGANVGFGIGAAAVIGAAVLWFTGAPERSRRVAIVPATNGFTLFARF